MFEPRDGSFVAHIAALRARGPQPTNKALIDQAFGRSGTQTTGTGK
jgi:hypothetical protein